MGVSGRPKGAKNQKTLDREAKRALYDKLCQELFVDTIDVHQKAVLKEANSKERIEYLHQHIGKPTETHNVNIVEYEED